MEKRDSREIVDDETLRGWIQECDPYQPVGPDNRRYVNFYEIEIEGKTYSLRGKENVLFDLYDVIQLSEGSSCQLFSGFSGTGKTSELRSLAEKLEGSGYTTLLVNARDYHDLNHELAIEDLLVIIAGAFGDAVSQHLGRDVIEESYWTRLRAFLQQEVELTDAKLPAGITDLKIAIRHARPFWLRTRDALSSSPGRLRDHAHDFIREKVALLEKANPRSEGVVFILDSLERLSAPVLEFAKVMESVVQVLGDYPEFLHLPECHVIYTVPPYVQLISPQLGDHYHQVSLVLPAIKVFEPGDPLRPYPPGIGAFKELIGRRIPIERIFGDRMDLLEKLILSSGGHVRTLITFLRDLLYRSRRGGLPVSESDVERVLQPFRERAQMAAWRETLPLLGRVLAEGRIDGLREEDYPHLARLMDTYVVLCYRNGEGWYEVHPLVRDHVREILAEIDSEETGA